MADKIGIDINIKAKDALRDIKKLEKAVTSITTKFEKQGTRVTSLEKRIQKFTKRSTDASNKRVRAIKREMLYNKKLKALESSGFDVKQGYVKGGFKRALSSGSPDVLKDARAFRDQKYEELMQHRRRAASQLRSGTQQFKKIKASQVGQDPAVKEKIAAKKAAAIADTKLTINEVRMSNKKLIRSTLMAKEAQKSLMSSTRKLNKTFLMGEISTRQYRHEIKKLQKTAKGTTFKGMISELNTMSRAYKYQTMALVGTGGLVAAVSMVGGRFETIRGTMIAASGSAQQAGKDFEFVKRLSMELGLNLTSSADAFSKLQIASRDAINQKQMKQFFTAFSQYSKTIGQTPQTYNNSIRAVSQMFSKGFVMSEELKGQLGESMPAALGIFAKAVGVTIPELMKMMEKGQIRIGDYVDELTVGFGEASKVGGALATQINGVNSAFQRANTTVLSFADIIFNSGIKDFATGILNTFSSLVSLLEPVGAFVGGLFKPLGVALNIFSTIINQISNMVSTQFPEMKSLINSIAAAIGTLVGVSATWALIMNIGAMVSGLTKFLSIMGKITAMMRTQAVLQAIITGLKNPALLATGAIGGFAVWQGTRSLQKGGSGQASVSGGAAASSGANITVNPTFIVEGFEPKIREVSTQVVNENTQRQIQQMNDGN